MSKHKPVSRLRWQASLKLISDRWSQKSLSAERERLENTTLSTIRHYAEQYTEDASVLEIGGGPCCISRLLNLKHKTYIDPLIDDFRRMFPGELPEDAEYLATVAERISKPANSYDLILCLNMLSHSLNPELIMHEIERLLKANGTLILSIRTHCPIESRLHYWAMQFCPFLCKKTRPYYYSLTGIQRTLQRHFNIIEEKRLNIRPFSNPYINREWHLFVCTHKTSHPHTSGSA
ncbi:MAG: methyltransferase domain-containing protein [Mariprofundus sp.]|nr:methyltransferase domain-containing protein [Mariprofundus sp.]